LAKKQAHHRSRKRIQNLRAHPEPYVTVGELANYWLVSRKLIYGHIESGALKAVKLGPRLLRIQTAAAIEFEKRAKLLPGTISAQRLLPPKSTSRLQRRRS
jgi:excisionase family DNA binding protein